MRKLSLLAAAAMVAGGSAFAMDGGGVSISGTANFGVKFAESDDDSKSELQFHHEFDVKFSASGTTDGGIGFGGSMTIDNTESVSGRTAVAAPTAYLLTEDATDEKAAALEKKYGIKAPTGGFVKDSVIISDPKTFSGYKIATIPGHKYTSTKKIVPYRAIDTVERFGDNEEASLTVGGVKLTNIASITYADTDGDEGISAGDTVTIAFKPVNGAAQKSIVFTYDDVDPGTGTGQEETGWVATSGLTGADFGEVRAGEEYTGLLAAQASALTATITTTNALIGDERTAASKAYIDNLSGSITEADSQSVNNHGEVYISMDMHKLTMGSDIDAADKLAGGLADPGFDGIGIDDVAEGPYGGSAADVRYDGDFGVAKVAISYGDNAGDAAWAAGFSFNVEPVNFGAGFDSNGVMSVGMGFTQGAIAMNALYSTDSDHDEADNEGFKCSDVSETNKATYNKVKADACTAGIEDNWANKPDLKNQAFGVDVSYQMSEATSVVLVAAQHKMEKAHISYNHGGAGADKATGTSDDVQPSYSWSTTSTTVDAFGVGFSHDLGGGATLKAGAGSVDSDAVADLGITMTF